MNVLVSDPIGEEGLRILREHYTTDVRVGLTPQELLACIGEYDALIVRSETRVTREVLYAGERLQVVGRAGVGVDNIDLEAATERGIVVVNAPASNTISAAEQTMALMLALARNTPQAMAALVGGRWARQDYVGVELRGKVLGIIGLGRVGTEVARRARSFEMRLLGYDPYITPEHAQNLGVELGTLEDVLRRSDFLTVHTPLTGTTRALIGRAEIEMMKPTVRLLNVARGGIIDEEALQEALEAGRVAGAALDVYAKEPAIGLSLFASDKVVVTPHLGASTTEAQAGVAVDTAEQVVDVLEGRSPRYAVNIPLVQPETLALLRPYVDVAAGVGKLASQLSEGPASHMTIHYAGEIAGQDTAILKAALLGGFLATVSEERVNLVNANIVAQNRGLRITEQKQPQPAAENFTSLVTVEVHANDGPTVVSGTVVRGEAHIVRVNDYWLEMVPTGGLWLIVEHTDRPGMIGNIGAITGENDINISSMQVVRLRARGPALTVLGLDEPIGDAQRRLIEQIRDVQRVRVVEL